MMTLRSLHLTRFGRFTDDSWEFTPGLNVIRGPNEAGKSTMREAIVRLLFDTTKVGTTSSRFLGMTTWGAERAFVLECTFDVDGERYRLSKDFEAQRIELTPIGGDWALTDDGAVAERLAELIGAHSREVYETTACLRQLEFARLEAGEEVSGLLQQTLAGPGAQAGVQDVLNDLARELTSMAKGLERHADSPGPLRATMDEIDELDEEITRLSPIVSEARSAGARAGELIEERGEIDQELQQRRALQERAERRRNLQGELSDLNERCTALERSIRNAERLGQRIAEIEERLEGLPDVSEEEADELRALMEEAQRTSGAVPEAEEEARRAAEAADEAGQRASEAERAAPDAALAERARDLSREVEQAEAGVSEAEQLVEQADRDLAEARRAGVGQRGWLAAAAVLLVAGIALAFGLGEPLLGLISVAGLVAAVIAATRAPRMAAGEAERRRGEATQRLEDRRAEATQLRERLSDLLQSAGVPDVEALARLREQSRAEVEEARQERTRAATVAETARQAAEKARQQAEIAQARLKHRLEQLDAQDAERFLAAADEVFTLRRRVAALQAELKGVLGDRTVAEMDAEFSELNSDRRGIADELESADLAHAELSPEEYQELISRIEALEEQRERVEGELAQVRRAAEHPDADAERLRSLQERRSARAERLERLRERHEATRLAHELLDRAHRETLSAAIDVLEPRTQELLGSLTCGRYGRIRFDRGDLTPQVFSPDRDDWVQVDADRPDVSCATREQVYLAARLALTELLWPERRPVIMLDDALVNFDAMRREQALGIIRTLAPEQQVLLFTCHDTYDQAADTVIELPGP